MLQLNPLPVGVAVAINIVTYENIAYKMRAHRGKPDNKGRYI